MSGAASCAWCGASSVSAVIDGAERQFRALAGATQRYRVCSDCGSYTADAPFAALARHYPSDYYAFGPVRDGVLTRVVRGARARAAFGRLSVLGRLVMRRYGMPLDLAAVARARPGREARLLDVGAGQGRLVRDLVHAGARHVVGWDPFGPEEAGPPRLTRHVEGRRGPWDLVMYHHSLEHIDEPSAELATARDALAQGGRILVRVPLADSEAAARYGADWVQLDAPRHRAIPTREGMARLAARLGLRIVDAWRDSTAFQFWGSELYRRGGYLSEHGSAAPFPAAEVARWEAEAGRANAAERGDQGAFLLERGVHGE